MALIRFKDLQIRNFKSYRELDLSFDPPGLKVLQGPIGSGKTSILSAIIFALFGRADRGKKGSLVNDQVRKNCLVQLSLSVDSDDILVRRGIKPNVFEVVRNGESIRSSSDNELQEILEKEILQGLSKRVLENLMFISVDKGLSFFNMSPKERGEFLMFFLDLSLEDRIKEILSRLIELLEREESDLSKKIGKAEGIIEEKKKDIKNKKGKLQNAEAVLSSLEEKLDSLPKIQQDLKEVEESVQDLQKKIEEMSSSLSERRKEKEEKEEQLDFFRKEIKKYEALSLSEDCLEEVKTHIVPALEQRIQDLRGEIGKIEGEIDHLEEALDNFKRDLRGLNLLLSNLRQQESTLLSLQGRRDEILSELEERKKQIESDEKKLKEMEELIEELQRKELLLKKRLDFWKTISRTISKEFRSRMLSVFSPKVLGMANSFLGDVGFPFRIDESQEISKDMVLKDLITGAERPYEILSTGQRRLVDFGILMAFQQILSLIKGISINLSFLDEFFGSLDIDYLQEVIEVLKDVSVKDEKTIILTAHQLSEPISGAIHWIVERGPHTGGYSVLQEVSY